MTSWRELTGGVWMRTALAGLTLAMALCIWATVHALRVSDVRAAPATVSIVAGALNASSSLSVVDVATVIDVDLFSPERTAPAARYRMPGEAAPATTAPEPPKPIVLGTALAADGTSFATCQFESSRLLMVRVGDRVGDYVVKTIARGRVVFATPAGKTFEVLAPRAGS